MKTSLLKTVILLLLITCFRTGTYAQYGTGAIPSLLQPLDTYYDYVQGTLGAVRKINYNGTTGVDRSIYSIVTGTDHVGGFTELFRVCDNGTTALFARYGSYPTLNFYTANQLWLGSINLQNENMNIKAFRAINLYPRDVSTVTFDTNESLFKTNVKMEKNNIQLHLGLNDDNTHGWIGTMSDHGLYFGAGRKASIYLDHNRGVFIGLDATQASRVKAELKEKYSLFVVKGVLSEDFAIAPKNVWADFVFEKDYRLKSLRELERFITENKHLPEVPSAQEVADNGYSQHEINKILLQKVEELTLYVIQQNKKIEKLEAQLNN